MARFINVLMAGISALAGLETRVALVDHIGTAAAADHPAETVAFFDRFERIDDFHCLFLCRARQYFLSGGGTYWGGTALSTAALNDFRAGLEGDDTLHLQLATLERRDTSLPHRGFVQTLFQRMLTACGFFSRRPVSLLRPPLTHPQNAAGPPVD